VLKEIEQERKEGLTTSIEEESDLSLLKEIAQDREELQTRKEELEKMKVRKA
jgi:hypothetical protein